MQTLRRCATLSPALLLALAGPASAGRTSVALLGISGHDPASQQIATEAQASLHGALTTHFALVSGQKYKKVAAALDATSPDPKDVASVSSALRLGYLIAGLVEPNSDGHDVTITVRRGADGQVLNKFHYTVTGDALDDATADKLDQEIISAIEADGGTSGAAGSDAESAAGGNGGDDTESGGTSEENPLGSAAPAAGSTDNAEATGTAEGEGPAAETEVVAQSGQTLGKHPSWQPLAEVNAGLTLLARSFTYQDPREQRFSGNAAPALHASGAVYPLAGSGERRAIDGLGVGGSIDYGLVYGTPFGGSQISTFQEQLEGGLRYRMALHPRADSPVIEAGLSYGAHIFEIKQAAGVAIPNISLQFVSVAVGAILPLARTVQLFANLEGLVPTATSDSDVNRYGNVAAGIGFEAQGGVAVLPNPWLELLLSADVIRQTYAFSTQQVATETYFGGTVGVGILY